MIEIKELSHSIGKSLILDNISLTVEDGSVMGLIGINGAGKSTLLRNIAGVYQPTRGEVLVDGVNSQDPKAREGLFFLPDDPYYTANATGKGIFDMYKNFFPNMDKKIFSDYLADYSIDEKKSLRTFSKGMRRQLYIALAFAARPKHLLLDEAFDGLDPLSRLTCKRRINALVEETGASVIISSHSLRELEDFCDKYVMLDNKRIAAGGDITESVSALCKFELAFATAPDRSVFEHLSPLSVELNGKFARVVLEGDADEMRGKLSELSPLVMEELPVDFEEAFISRVKGRIDG